MVKKIAIVCVSFFIIFSAHADLQKGDLLFQDLACGELCDAIADTTQGFDGKAISHVGMVVDTTGREPRVIEAFDDGVNEVTLSMFLGRSSDAEGKSRVMVGRLAADYQYLIPAAIYAAEQQLGQPYNSNFLLSSKGFYCSQLIYYAFKQANNADFFVLRPMNFKDLKTNLYSEAWRQYFDAMHETIPQGALGINPGALSLDPRVEIVSIYGELSENTHH